MSLVSLSGLFGILLLLRSLRHLKFCLLLQLPNVFVYELIILILSSREIISISLCLNPFQLLFHQLIKDLQVYLMATRYHSRVYT